MKKIIVSNAYLILFVCPGLWGQTWNAPINVTVPYSGVGGYFTTPDLLVVNGNPAMAFRDGTRGHLLFMRATDPTGTSWSAPVPVDISGFVAGDISLQLVNGNPAISYHANGVDGGDLKYVRSTDVNGSVWAAPLTIDLIGSVGQYNSMQVVNGNPAISYYGNSRLKYIRATDANGTTWATPDTIDGTVVTGQHTSLQVINGNPAIAYLYFTNGTLKYVRAIDVDGNAWGTPVSVDPFGGGEYCSMQVVNGHPAISYYEGIGAEDLKYVRANDINGVAWAAPLVLESAGKVGLHTSLQIVNGNPAIAYFNENASLNQLKYIRATDASGIAWDTPVLIDVPGLGSFTSLQIVNGKPSVSHQNGSWIKYLNATNVSGTAWDSPIFFSNSGLSGQYSSLEIINGVPAISFFNVGFFGDLLYVQASDVRGDSWSTAVFADGNGKGKYSSLAKVNGNPAIAYYDDFTAPATLRYRRANDANGSTWATSVLIGTIGPVETRISMQVVNGNPAIAYFDDAGDDLKYVRATDANGVAWATPIPVDVPGSAGQTSTMQIVNGNPAILYYSSTGDLKFVRATNVNGTTWAPPIVVESGLFGVAWEAYYSLEIVDGNPAVSYYNSSGHLKYARANDVNGSSWGMPVIVDNSGNVGRWMSMQEVSGNPAISYYDATNRNLRYVRATDIPGTTWGAPVSLDSTGDVGQYNSMQVINGNPAISYYDATNRLLRFIRSADFDLPTKVVLCPFGNTSLTSSITGTAYQWQVNTGSGFVNIIDGANYSGTSTVNLQLTNISSSWYGYQYRCVVDGSHSYPYSLKFQINWIGSVSTSWENTANWDCGILPDSNVDAVITSGTVILSSNTTCRSLTVKTAASFSINTGFTLTVIQ